MLFSYLSQVTAGDDKSIYKGRDIVFLGLGLNSSASSSVFKVGKPHSAPLYNFGRDLEMNPSPSYDDLPHQQDNSYALTILTQAAMQTNTNNKNSSSNKSDSISNATGSSFPRNNPFKNNTVLTSRDADYHSRATPTTISSSTISNHPSDISQYHLSSSSTSTSNLVGDFTRPYRAMETLVFNPTDQIPQSAFMNHPFQPTYPSSLGILNAERYDDGRSSIRSENSNMINVKGQMQNQIPFGMLEKSGDSSDTRPPSEEQEQGKKRKKRVRNESPNLDDDEEARKKARGRPRVDTKDETAADVSLPVSS